MLHSPEANGESSGSGSSQVLSLLLQLTVDSDPSLHDYIREPEPFPEIDIFNGVRIFHEEICPAYAARDHLLKFVKRSCYLPSRLLSWRAAQEITYEGDCSERAKCRRCRGLAF